MTSRLLDARIASALNNFSEFLLQEKGQSGGRKSLKRRPTPSRKTDRLLDLRLLPGHWRQRFRIGLCRLIYWLLFDMTSFRSSTQDGTKNYDPWSNSHLSVWMFQVKLQNVDQGGRSVVRERVPVAMWVWWWHPTSQRPLQVLTTALWLKHPRRCHEWAHEECAASSGAMHRATRWLESPGHV